MSPEASFLASGNVIFHIHKEERLELFLYSSGIAWRGSFDEEEISEFLKEYEKISRTSYFFSFSLFAVFGTCTYLLTCYRVSIFCFMEFRVCLPFALNYMISIVSTRRT